MPATRSAVPADYDSIVSVVDGWFGRPMTSALPRLFLDHFCDSSLVAEDNVLAGFLVGFPSGARNSEAYIHFIGVRPDLRGRGLARTLYEEFFGRMKADGRNRVTAITSPANTVSIAFHTAMGFDSELIANYHGPGVDRVVFRRCLS